MAQVALVAPPGSHSHASGTVWELTHAGQVGINVLAGGLLPGRYEIWLLGPHARATPIATVSTKGGLHGAYALPADATAARQIVVATQAPGKIKAPGRSVLSATLP
jgi:hypothetical protein